MRKTFRFFNVKNEQKKCFIICRNLKKSQDKIKANQTAIDQIVKKRVDLNARLEKLEELAKTADEKRNEIEVNLRNVCFFSENLSKCRS